jgi:hypothetical protein
MQTFHFLITLKSFLNVLLKSIFLYRTVRCRTLWWMRQANYNAIK